MHLLHPFREFRIGPCFHPGLNEGAIEPEIDLRDARDRCELALVLYAVAAERADVIKSPCFETDEIAATDQLDIRVARLFRRHHRFVEAWRQYVDEINVARKFVVLLLGHRAGDENAEMADRLMHGVDDGLSPGTNVIDATVEIENPAERLGGRRDVVCFGAKHDDRRADAAQINGLTVCRNDIGSSELVADEQLIGDELHLFGVKQDMAAPPVLKFEIAWRFGVDL